MPALNVRVLNIGTTTLSFGPNNPTIDPGNSALIDVNADVDAGGTDFEVTKKSLKRYLASAIFTICAPAVEMAMAQIDPLLTRGFLSPVRKRWKG
jgi:hypothetical protein